MPEINLPEVKLPDIKLPEGLRDMTRDDIVHAARDVRLPRMELPKRVELPDIDFSKLDLPKPIADRLPGRKRRNPLVPFVGLAIVGAVAAAIWWLFTSPETGPRARAAVNDLKAKVTGRRHDLVRYDDEQDLGSLLSDDARSPMGGPLDPTPSRTTTPDLGAVPVGPGEDTSLRTTH